MVLAPFRFGINPGKTDYVETRLWVRLRERRRELGIGTAEAAAICGVSQGAYSRYENGRAPNEEALAAIATFLGISRAEVVLLRSGEDEAAADHASLRADLAELRREVARLSARIPSIPGSE
jgi:transcriptional regulator with XRE-family HTH domain